MCHQTLIQGGGDHYSVLGSLAHKSMALELLGHTSGPHNHRHDRRMESGGETPLVGGRQWLEQRTFVYIFRVRDQRQKSCSTLRGAHDEFDCRPHCDVVKRSDERIPTVCKPHSQTFNGNVERSGILVLRSDRREDCD